MAKLTNAEFIAAIKELSVLELNELVKACEEEFGVSAAAGVVVAAAGPAEGSPCTHSRFVRRSTGDRSIRSYFNNSLYNYNSIIR